MGSSLVISALSAIWYILPAYIANASPVVLAKIVKNRHPIDFGAKFIDGKRILGDSKTIEGFFFGVAMGFLTGVVQGVVVDRVRTYVVRGLLLSLGAMLGDCLGSFIKRRLGLRPGKPAPFIDQTLFLLVAMLLAYLGGVYSLTMYQTLFLLVITPVLHVLSNVGAYLLKLKNVPW